ncbi:methyltransferase RsmF C-terminal domain-like protein [Olivibacter sitiensis]|uniref:methyltransferase RsmF C-terminal domain-like protein n=1 Tax=Olivibacter sitiensis TaxID=376470 RepID=UPI00040FD9CE|nr:RNA methyltransferase [Olivibacter sitiensis]
MSNFLPSDLLQKLSSLFSEAELSAFVQSHESNEQVTSIRINPKKFDAASLAYEQVPWCDTGYYLADRPIFTLDPLFHAGAYYVQEASSMFIAHLLQQLGLTKEGIKALDLCAAPGGKSTLLNSYLHSSSLLVSNEIIKSRVGMLADNLTKWGNPNIVVSNNDPSAFARLPAFFDLLLVDAPCSGSGMFRKDKKSREEWSPANVQLCSMRQKRILADSLSTLSENGWLFYSTCSYSNEENEEICDWLVDEYAMEPVAVDIPSTWGIVETLSVKHRAPGYRFYPHRLSGEGFFIAVLRKTSPEQTLKIKKGKNTKPPIDLALLSAWVDDPTDLHFFALGDDILFLPDEHTTSLQLLQQQLYLKKAGTRAGTPIKKQFVPHHELAMSNRINPDIPKTDLTLKQALEYLRKNDVGIVSGERAWMLASYLNHPLGWLKLLGNRANNYYPKELRIVNL